MMTFREFLQLKEQGTPFSATGLNAAGRAGQSQASPEKMGTVKPAMGNKKGKSNIPKSIPASAFNVSSKMQTNWPRPWGSMNPGGVIKVTAPSPKDKLQPKIQRFGIGPLQGLTSTFSGINPIKSPRLVSF